MRCPKCGFNSFDHNLACPKCRKDLSVVRRQLNLTMPISGPVGFFLAADQYDIIPEPGLGAGLDEGEALVADSFSSTSFAAVPSYAAPGPDAHSSYPVEALVIEGVLPLEDDSIDDITPIEEVEEFLPLMDTPAVPDGPPTLYSEVQPPYSTAPPQCGEEAQYPLPPQAQATAPVFQASPPVYPEIPDYLSLLGASAPMSLANRPTDMSALISDWEDEEIEIEIEAEGLEDIMPVDIPVPQAVKDQANAAMGQIMNALAETGDLAPKAVISQSITELQETPAFLGQELDLDELELNFDEQELSLDELESVQAADEEPGALGQQPDVTQPQAVEAEPAAEESEDLANLVDEIDLDDLDSEL